MADFDWGKAEVKGRGKAKAHLHGRNNDETGKMKNQLYFNFHCLIFRTILLFQELTLLKMFKIS